MKKVNYRGWPSAHVVTNGILELVVTGDVGPRIISAGFVGQKNLLREIDAEVGRTGNESWLAYGGHRLWHAPEDRKRTYVPDNQTIEITETPHGLRATQPVEAETGIQKEIELTLATDDARVLVTHRLTNRGAWNITTAAWAITMLGEDTVAVAPLPAHRSHGESLLPESSLAMWGYTDLKDPRWSIGSKFIMLRQERKLRSPQKLGLSGAPGWVGALTSGTLLIKRFNYSAEARYPDMNSAVEVFTNHEMLEIETLGPLREVAPGETIEHAEEWRFVRDVRMPRSEAELETLLATRLG